MPDKKPNKYYDWAYESLPRWVSYWYQIHAVLSLSAKSVLEIGIGNQVVTDYLKTVGLAVTTLDIDPDLKPDIVASVTKMPVQDESFDAVLAAEILEHLPWQDFSIALAELRRATKKYAVISLPHWGSALAAAIKIPAFPWLRAVLKLPGWKKHSLDVNGHYWEIGKRGYSLNRVKKIMRQAGFTIVRDYIIVDYPYHHFFVLTKT